MVPKLGALSFLDYKQIEPRLLAYFAAKVGDTDLADKINSGLDPYTAIVSGMYGENVTEEQRQRGKVLFLMLMYGAGVKKVQAEFGVSQTEARKMVNQFHDAWPVVRDLQDMVQRVHARRGYIVGLDGRRLHMEQYGEHKLLNKLIQGSAAGIMKQALVRVHRWLQETELESHIVSVIHDELIIDGPVGPELTALHCNVPVLMSHEQVNEIVPVVVDHEVSTTNWAEKIAYEEWAEKEVAA